MNGQDTSKNDPKVTSPPPVAEDAVKERGEPQPEGMR